MTTLEMLNYARVYGLRYYSIKRDCFCLWKDGTWELWNGSGEASDLPDTDDWREA